MRKSFTIDRPRSAMPPESAVWFHLDIGGDGAVTALEEHEGYAGGPIGRPGDDLAALFVERVRTRSSRPDEDVARALEMLAARAA